MTRAHPRDAPPARSGRVHWMLRLNHRVRVLMGAMFLVTIGSHLYAQVQPPEVWLSLLACCLVYPHLVYQIGQRAPQPMRAETAAMGLDLWILGMWLAFLGYPLWIGYVSALGLCVGFSAYFAWKGLISAALALVAGMGSATLIWGVRLSPDTNPYTTALCMAQLAICLLLVAVGSKQRAAELKATRKRLSENEQALQRQLSEIQSLQHQLTEQANRDPLTGTYNRRYLDATLPRELARCWRDGLPLSLILIDIDHFKRVNDTFGHPAGDEVIRSLAGLLQAQSREGDVVCRHGGEEFLVMLPNMAHDAAVARAERFRLAFADFVIPVATDQTLRATLSAGVATTPTHGNDQSTLLRNVDDALYRAKKMGRNRVMSAEPPP